MPAGAKIFLRTCACGCGKEFKGSSTQKYASLRCRENVRNKAKSKARQAMPKQTTGRKTSVTKDPQGYLSIYLNKETRKALGIIHTHLIDKTWNQCVCVAITALALNIQLNKGGIQCPTMSSPPKSTGRPL